MVGGVYVLFAYPLGGEYQYLCHCLFQNRHLFKPNSSVDSTVFESVKEAVIMPRVLIMRLGMRLGWPA